MKRFELRKGLDIPVTGAPTLDVDETVEVRSVGIIGDDYLDLKPRISVAEGDAVSAGTPILHDKNMPEALITSPVAGRVRAINRGARRKLISVVIDIDENAGDPVDFSDVGDLATRDGVVERLCAAGLWPSFRTRPYSKVPAIDAVPEAIYITATDTEPLSGDPNIAISRDAQAFETGVKTVAQLSGGPTYLCQGEGDPLPGHDAEGVEAVVFTGPHPAGLAGTHMHFLTPPAAD